MGQRSAEVDVYIERAQPFARPILKKLRALFNRACPAIEEKLKCGAPSFEYKGMLGGMAAFKQHVRWRLWKARLLKDPHGVLRGRGGSGWGKPTTVTGDAVGVITHIPDAIGDGRGGFIRVREWGRNPKPE